jgi:alpha-tubulin suppressor-like RCC1 family protein
MHSCASRGDGAVRCWGGGDELAEVEALRGARFVSIGGEHTCAIVDDALRCFGDNDYGQLGDATTERRADPVPVSLPGPVANVAAGEWHTCALASGAVYCWGRNRYGQLGDGTTTERHAPGPAVDIAGALAITGGEEHTCAWTDSGLSCWGNNGRGQLGDGTFDNRGTPGMVELVCPEP